MTDQLARLRAEIEAQANDINRDIARHQDRLGVLQHVLMRIDKVMVESPTPAAPIPDPAPERREKRDVRAAVIAVLQDIGPRTAPVLRDRVSATIGGITDSALARTLSSMVGAGRVIERAGVFSLPATAAPETFAEAAK